VDFASFAASIRSLVEQCTADPKFRVVLSLESPDATRGMSTGDAVLSFKETSSFRELCHLALQVRRGSDAHVKDYLAECLKQLQSQCEAEQSKTRYLEEELNACKSNLVAKEEELTRAGQAANAQSTGELVKGN